MTVLEGLCSQPGSIPRREFVIFATLCKRKAIKKIAKRPSIHDVSSKGEGVKEGQKCRNLLTKKMTKGEEGGHKIRKMDRRCLWIAPKIADVATFYDCSLKNVQTNNGTYGLKEPEIGLKCTLSLMFGHISHCALLY